MRGIHELFIGVKEEFDAVTEDVRKTILRNRIDRAVRLDIQDIKDAFILENLPYMRLFADGAEIYFNRYYEMIMALEARTNELLDTTKDVRVQALSEFSNSHRFYLADVKILQEELLLPIVMGDYKDAIVRGVGASSNCGAFAFFNDTNQADYDINKLKDILLQDAVPYGVWQTDEGYEYIFNYDQHVIAGWDADNQRYVSVNRSTQPKNIERTMYFYHEDEERGVWGSHYDQEFVLRNGLLVLDNMQLSHTRTKFQKEKSKMHVSAFL